MGQEQEKIVMAAMTRPVTTVPIRTVRSQYETSRSRFTFTFRMLG